MVVFAVWHVSSSVFNCVLLGSCPVEQLATIVLDSKGVCAVGDDEDLSKLCPRVQELHLSSNCITHSSDVCISLHVPVYRHDLSQLSSRPAPWVILCIAAFHNMRRATQPAIFTFKR